MGNKQKVTVTIHESLIKEVDRLAKEKMESRSKIIEGALKIWRQKLLERDLIEGYMTMEKENVEMAEANLEASAEVLK